MKRKDISLQEVELIVNFVTESLKTSNSINWITKSSLLKRAYLIGVWQAVSALNDKDDFTKIFLPHLSETMWESSLDDTFPTTQLGEIYLVLKNSIENTKIENLDELKIDELINNLNNLNKTWQDRFEYTLRIISKIRKIMIDLQRKSNITSLSNDQLLTDDLNYLIRKELDDALRFLSLLETNHKTNEKFET
jgi:hypothetical protein